MTDRDLQAPYRRPAGATEVILVRHGSSLAAEDDRVPLGGQADPSLSSLGESQAKAVGRLLGGLDPSSTSLFVTNLRRTVQTAQPTADALGLTPIVVSDLREICLGEYEGAAFETRRRAGDPLLHRVFAEERWDLLPGAESMPSFGARVRRGLASLVECVPPESTAVAFVHGGVIAEVCRHITDSRAFAFVDVENGSVTRLTHHNDRTWRLRSFNDTAHL
ncbi:histidine phosphatase family protein [Rhodococcus opacus]|uniref:histidine phosphatase family protein n=1 Tax=Rhodococcus opacus TaxID=37919 RepID=UPI001FF25852|nr:histidine phosphatase family protein [Rhodococcus opacus]UOT03278.1 histidine phosphatase family protein [Rhodococcus opacus]